MILARMVVLSLMVGLVAAGAVWFGCDLLATLRAFRARPAQPAPPEAETEPPAQAAEQE